MKRKQLMEGNIFDIQRFCVHDGPGIRTTVFFKGCPLRCIWCHNPESQKSQTSLAFYSHKCILCGACVLACPQNCHNLTGIDHTLDRSLCINCGECSKACQFEALEFIGRKESVSEIMTEVLRDVSFYKNSGGGLTVSGGEPLMQAEFLLELLKSAKENGLHTCVETCGYASRDTVAEVANYTDIFLFDIKETDEERHKDLTGVSFAPIKENLDILNKLGSGIILRCPLIPGVNTFKRHFEAIASIASEIDNLIEVNVMAYHLLGNGKYDALDMDNKMLGCKAMTSEEKNECIKIIFDLIKQKSGKTVKVC